jgi:hypothetical protein
MKKVISTLLILLGLGMLTAGYFVYDRFGQNPEQIFPYPYQFQSASPALKLDAPILITGDRMGAYFAKYSSELSANISINLSKPIKIQSIASQGRALHRSLHELKSLIQWPQILIYQGASEELMEQKFDPQVSSIIKKNFELYKDDRIETLIMLFPWLSRLVYWPHPRIKLSDSPQLLSEVNEEEYFKLLDTELLLFEQQLIQLVNLSRNRGSMLILTTTPLNLDVAPRKSCTFTSPLELQIQLKELDDLMTANNPKGAYSLSQKLIKQYSGNADLLFKHGLISKRLGLIDEAKNSLIQATAFDCDPWRSNLVYNSIIRRVARNHQVTLFDFAKLVENQWNQGPTFFDDIYPQNLFYEKAMKQLGLLLRQILKL